MKESDALGGSVRNQMQNEIWPEKRYFGSFAGMSWISHGSVLARREISRAVESAGSDLLNRAADDGNGNDWRHHAGWIVLKLAGYIEKYFDFLASFLKSRRRRQPMHSQASRHLHRRGFIHFEAPLLQVLIMLLGARVPIPVMVGYVETLTRQGIFGERVVEGRNRRVSVFPRLWKK